METDLFVPYVKGIIRLCVSRLLYKMFVNVAFNNGVYTATAGKWSAGCVLCITIVPVFFKHTTKEPYTMMILNNSYG